MNEEILEKIEESKWSPRLLCSIDEFDLLIEELIRQNN